MKKILFIIAAIALTGMVACNDSEDPKDGKLTLSTESLEFPAAGDTKTVDVTGRNWTATESDPWIGIEQSEGKITVTIGKNETTGARTGSITVKNADDTQTISVTQAASSTVVDPTLTLDPLKVEFPVGGGSETVTVTSEPDWEAIPTADWIEVVSSEGSFTITVAACPLASGRSAVVTVSNGNEAGMKYVAVEQAGTGASISEFTEDVNLGTLKLGVLSYSPDMFDGLADTYLTSSMSGDVAPSRYGYTGTGYVVFSSQFNTTTGSNEVIPAGTYQIARKTDPWYVLSGFTPNGSVLAGLWIRKIDNGVEVQKGPVVYGTIEVSRADDIYTIEIDGLDDKGNKITATLTGTGAL